MEQITFNSMQELFNHIHSRGGANPSTHGMLGTFYALMGVYSNPNTCNCKKGPGAFNNIMNTCKTLSTMHGDVLDNSRAMFDGKQVIVNEGGREIVRF